MLTLIHVHLDQMSFLQVFTNLQFYQTEFKDLCLLDYCVIMTHVDRHAQWMSEKL